MRLYRGVEQLEARRAHNPEVVGSSPASATIIRVVEFGNSDFLFSRFFNFLAHATQSIGLSSVRTLAYTFQTIELFYMQW